MTNESPLVSVLMPVYNAENSILYSLSSLLAQTYKNWECVLVNDGSTDSTLEKVSIINDDRIRVFSFERNCGRGAARKKTLELARGKYITMLDADDWIYPQKLQMQVGYLQAHSQISLHSTGMAITDQNFLVGVRSGGNTRGDYSTFHVLSIPHAAAMIRREAIANESYDENLVFAQDQDFIRRILVGRKYITIPSAYYVYEEVQSVKMRKMFFSYLYNSRAYLKLVPVFGVPVVFVAIFEIVKSFYFFIKCCVVGRKKVLAGRSEAPNNVQIEEHRSAKKIVDTVYFNLF